MITSLERSKTCYCKWSQHDVSNSKVSHLFWTILEHIHSSWIFANNHMNIYKFRCQLEGASMLDYNWNEGWGNGLIFRLYELPIVEREALAQIHNDQNFQYWCNVSNIVPCTPRKWILQNQTNPLPLVRHIPYSAGPETSHMPLQTFELVGWKVSNQKYAAMQMGFQVKMVVTSTEISITV